MVINPAALVAALDTAPAWAKIGLTVPQDRLREAAYREIAEHVYATLRGPETDDQSQLALPL